MNQPGNPSLSDGEMSSYIIMLPSSQVPPSISKSLPIDRIILQSQAAKPRSKQSQASTHPTIIKQHLPDTSPKFSKTGRKQTITTPIPTTAKIMADSTSPAAPARSARPAPPAPPPQSPPQSTLPKSTTRPQHASRKSHSISPSTATSPPKAPSFPAKEFLHLWLMANQPYGGGAFYFPPIGWTK